MSIYYLPRARQLMEFVQAGQYHSSKHCEIHVGEQDWQSNPDNVQALAKLMAGPAKFSSGDV